MSGGVLVRFEDVGLGPARRTWEARVAGPPPARSAVLAALLASGTLPRMLPLDVRWLPGKEGTDGVVLAGGRIAGRFACLPVGG